jgi:Flp pilus assembly protein TadB
MAAFALARADVSPWLVAWYALTVVWIVVAGVAVVTVIDRAARRRLRRDQLQWPAALAVVGLALIVGHPGIWGAM